MPRAPLADHIHQARRFHSIQRAAERYGVSLDPNEWAYLNKAIRDGKHKHNRVANLQARRAAYRINYKGSVLLAVYSHHDHEITTFLPPDHQF